MSRRLTAVLTAALASAAALPALAAPAPLVIKVDKSFGKTAGWSVGYSENLNGCLAAATYNDETTVWLGYNGQRDVAYVGFTNPKWRALEVGGQYPVRLVTNSGGRWGDVYTGFSYGDAPGVFQSGLNSRFLSDLSNAGLISVEIKGRRVAMLSLVGSTEALEAVRNCQKSSGVQQAKVDGVTPVAKPAVESKSSSGTGFYVSTKGHVLTNQHVVDGCREITVAHVGAAPMKARLVAADAANDLAVLATETTPPEVPPLAVRTRVGETVYAFGFPLSGLLATSGNFTVGNVTATAGLGDNTRELQISTPVQPGNSGGPLLDQFGNVAGVIVGKLNALKTASITSDIPQNVNFAIKTTTALAFLDANGIEPPLDARAAGALDGGTIAERAKAFTVRVVCQ